MASPLTQRLIIRQPAASLFPSGLVFRLRASDVVGVTAGNSIPATALIEKSGSGALMALIDQDHSPTYNVSGTTPIIRMRNNGGSAHCRIDVTNVPGFDVQNMTMFLAHQWSSQGDGYMVSFIGTQVRLIQSSGGNTLNWNNANNSPLAFGPALATNTKYVTMVRGTTAGAAGMADGADIWNNGVRLFRHRASSSNSPWGKDQNGTPIAGATSSFYIGSQPSGVTSSNWWGDLYEILLFNRALSNSESDTVQRYLAATYAVTLTQPTDLLIIDGDSLSNGVASDGLINALRNQMPATLNIKAYGIGGQTTPFLTSVGARVDAAYEASAAHKIVAYLGEPTNDLNSNSATGQAAYDNIATYATARKAAHSDIKLIVSDCIARTLTGVSSGFDTRRGDYNTLVHGALPSGADALVSPATDTSFDAAADAADATQYNVDGVHLVAGDATHGYGKAVALYYKPALDTILAS